MLFTLLHDQNKKAVVLNGGVEAATYGWHWRLLMDMRWKNENCSFTNEWRSGKPNALIPYPVILMKENRGNGCKAVAAKLGLCSIVAQVMDYELFLQFLTTKEAGPAFVSSSTTKRKKIT
ncbi:hypothetical protein Nepgr_007503 [Nepenthes gracilis]|uniref:Uncharacterized protein n=1 Tax=Nepenthes gracilis TaxID=150966 RepID=A0AAD3S744_NEPGR|nr:hypothetical protein Nepgr_007503 [Nepenthes gracilis]